jgi:hypothetical protein
MTDKNLLSRLVSELAGPAASELGQLVADQVRYIRGKQLVRIVDRAKLFTERHNLRSSHLPLKFLLPFIEHASLEDDDDELVDLWAKLLAKARDQFENFHLTCLNLLRVLSGREASMLRSMWAQTTSMEVWNAWNQPFPDLEQQIRLNNPFDLPEELEGYTYYVFHEDDVPNMNELNLNGFDEYIDLMHLRSLGLVEMICGSKLIDSKRVFYIMAKISPLGFQFVESCEVQD